MTDHQHHMLRRLVQAGDAGVVIDRYTGGPIGFLRSHGWARMGECDGLRCGFATPQGEQEIGRRDEEAERQRQEAASKGPEPEQMGLFGGTP